MTNQLNHSRKVYLVNRKSDGKHVVTKEIPIDDLPKAERQSALNEVNEFIQTCVNYYYNLYLETIGCYIYIHHMC